MVGDDWLLRWQSVPEVVKAIGRLVEEQPDRFTGVSCHGAVDSGLAPPLAGVINDRATSRTLAGAQCCGFADQPKLI